eukprot:Transcript_24638.p1 GENE.Transcript_24638~~Transcript_24638.p1  ORF type:complete len:601 (+),score=299.50 Transcript_24638:121-1923(+)
MSAEDKRAQVLEYLKQHNLQAILAQALNKVLTDLPNNPVDALCEQIQALSKAPTAAVESDEIVILHFNDVYEIEARAREPVGGASRFSTLLKQFAHEEPLILFSGDAFNPSMMSTVTKGKHMVPVLNCFNIHTACFGNHDFDFGVENLEQLAHDTNFPWLISNVFDATTGRPLAGGEASRLVEWRGHKIGLVGLVEEEWLVTLATISMDEVRYVDFVDEGRRLARQLKAQGAQLVIALSHMRQPNDERLVAEATEIDLVLGGHDHHYETKQIAGRWLLKSGTDFRDLSRIRLKLLPGGGLEVEPPEHFTVTMALAEDPEVKVIVDRYAAEFSAKMEEVVGETEVELDGRFKAIRTSETNLGNFVADIMRAAVTADVAILNSGTLRSDEIHPPGHLKLRDLVAILPMADATCVLSMTGAQLLAALENGVSKYPRLEGRFPQVSGVSFEFDSDAAPGARVVHGSVLVGEAPLEAAATYRVITKAYLALGKDGYDVFKECPVLIDEESAPVIPSIVRGFFADLQDAMPTPEPRSSVMKRRNSSRLQAHAESSAALLAVQAQLSTGALGAAVAFKTPQKAAPARQLGKIAPAKEGRIRCKQEGG